MVPLDKLVTVSCGNMNGARSTPLERLLHCHCTGTVLDMEAVEDIDDACWLTITVGNTFLLRDGWCLDPTAVWPGSWLFAPVYCVWLLSSHYLNIRVNLVKCFMKIKMLVLL